jgi:hypothetical protein
LQFQVTMRSLLVIGSLAVIGRRCLGWADYSREACLTANKPV